ncbi:hypothetical protein [Pseudonocardia sp. H11422]|uniref:hypothetical protein n=1 Tax=Pseudonocardia sp. H11422 TaxID=2835866 RepID=UPI001BDD9D0B|nr:hypothetical protein [Pseudonocardia sp. H11422]
MGEVTTISVTCVLDDLAHEIPDSELAAGAAVSTGRYRAVCGHIVAAAPMVVPDGQSCDACAAMLRARQRRGRRTAPLRLLTD